jgi:SAM-dependent methyltransferase
LRFEEFELTEGTTTARLASGQDADRVAPLPPNAWLRFDVVSRMLPPAITEVLEIGCGQGAFAVRLAQRYTYLGLEPDATSFAVAQRRIKEMGGRGEVRNIALAELDAGSFDMVCAFEVLEHIENDEAALVEWTTRLRPGGWLLLSMPANQSRYGPFDELVGHFRRYDTAGLTAMLTRIGFTDVEVRQFGVPLGFILEAGRNVIGRRRLAKAASVSVAERTAGSGRVLQPSSGMRGSATRWGTAPFRLMQRAFPNVGTGLVVRARLAERG